MTNLETFIKVNPVNSKSILFLCPEDIAGYSTEKGIEQGVMCGNSIPMLSGVTTTEITIRVGTDRATFQVEQDYHDINKFMVQWHAGKRVYEELIKEREELATVKRNTHRETEHGHD